MTQLLKGAASLADLLMVTRPVVLIPVWGFSALGFRAALNHGNGAGFSICWYTMNITDYANILIFSLSVAAVYIMNQIADIEADKKNGGMPLIASGIVSLRSSVILLFVCCTFSVVIPFLFQEIMLSAAAMATLIIGYFYSFKPCRFSGRPFVDFISNGFGYGIVAFAVGWITAEKTPFSSLFFSSSLPYFFLMCAGSISSTLPDIKGDLADNKFTTAVIFGKIQSHTLAFIFLLAAAAVSLLNNDIIALTGALTSLPFYIGFYIWKSDFFMEATYKIGGGFCMAAAFIALPIFIPISIVVFFITWLYFRIRHGISYPSLTNAKTTDLQS